MQCAGVGPHNFKSRITDDKTGWQLAIFGFTPCHRESNAGELRCDVDVRLGAHLNFINSLPERGLAARARKHERAATTTELLMLARIVESNFEHEGVRSTGRRQTLSLFKRIGYAKS